MNIKIDKEKGILTIEAMNNLYFLKLTRPILRVNIKTILYMLKSDIPNIRESLNILLNVGFFEIDKPNTIVKLMDLAVDINDEMHYR